MLLEQGLTARLDVKTLMILFLSAQLQLNHTLTWTLTTKTPSSVQILQRILHSLTTILVEQNKYNL